MSNRYRIVIVAVMVVGLVGYLLNFHDVLSPSQKAAVMHLNALKCPESYSTEEQKLNAFLEFTEAYVDLHPEVRGNEDAYFAGRADFLIEHKCVSTLMNLGYDGLIPLGGDLREGVIANMKSFSKGKAEKIGP